MEQKKNIISNNTIFLLRIADYLMTLRPVIGIWEWKTNDGD